MSEEVETVNEQKNQEVTVDPKIEQEARQFGWVSKEEYQGSEENWRSAETFLERGREINGFLRKDMDKLRHSISQKDQELNDLRETMQEFKKFHDQTEKRAIEKALAELKAQKKQALEDADVDKVIEIDEQIVDLKTSQKNEQQEEKKPEKKNITVPQEFIDWQSQNTWYGKDKMLTKYAEAEGELIRDDYPGIQGKNFLDKVSERLKERFPDKFDNPRTKASAVEGSSSNRPIVNSGKKTYSDLPPEAKAACDRFVKQGLLTKEQYISEFDW